MIQITDINNLLIGGVVIKPPQTVKIDENGVPTLQVVQIKNDEKIYRILFFYDITKSLTVGQNIIVKGNVNINEHGIIIACRNYTTCNESQNQGINEVQITGEIADIAKPLNAKGLKAKTKGEIHIQTIIIQYQNKYIIQSILVTAFDKVAQNLNKHAKKGSKILVKGTLKNLNKYKGVLLKEFAILAKPSDQY